MNERDQIDDLFERIEALVTDARAQFKEQFTGPAWGLNAITGEEHAAWYEENIGNYPPIAMEISLKGLAKKELADLKRVLGHEPYEGEIVTASKWALALAFAENVEGDAETRRYNKTRGLM